MHKLGGPLYLGLASADEWFAGRPSKKVSTCVSDKNFDFIGCYVNETYPGIPLSATAFSKKEGLYRGDLIGCSEKLASIALLGMPPISCATDDRQEQKQLVRNHEDQLYKAAAATEILRGYRFHVTLCPCASCRKLLITENPDGTTRPNVKAVYARENSERLAIQTRPDRQQTPNAIRELEESGLHLVVYDQKLRPRTVNRQSPFAIQAA
jgi:hypothetical protein